MASCTRTVAPAVQHDHAVFLRPAGRAVLRAVHRGTRLRVVLPVRAGGRDPAYLRQPSPRCAYRSLGASGAVSAVLFAFILLKPWSMIFVFFLPLPAIVYGVMYVGYSIWMDRHGDDNINHSAHLWGAGVRRVVHAAAGAAGVAGRSCRSCCTRRSGSVTLTWPAWPRVIEMAADTAVRRRTIGNRRHAWRPRQPRARRRRQDQGREQKRPKQDRRQEGRHQGRQARPPGRQDGREAEQPCGSPQDSVAQQGRRQRRPVASKTTTPEAAVEDGPAKKATGPQTASQEPAASPREHREARRQSSPAERVQPRPRSRRQEHGQGRQRRRRRGSRGTAKTSTPADKPRAKPQHHAGTGVGQHARPARSQAGA